MLSVTDRFWSKVEKTETCWLWKSTVAGERYGQFWYNNGYIGAHVYALMEAQGMEERPPHFVMCLHSCDVKLCVNPDHLRWGTGRENWEDSVERSGWKPPQRRNDHPLNGIKYCKYGHSRWSKNQTSVRCLDCLVNYNKRGKE